MEKLSKILENPIVQNGGRAGLVIVSAIITFKGVKAIGKWAAKNTAKFRADLSAHYYKTKEEARAKRETASA